RQSNFVSALEWFWNGWGAGRNDLMLIACGSATSWITDKLLADKGGLFNRATSRIYLHPFTLHETELYLQSKGIQWSRYDITECYMVMGGIPYYLRNLSPQLSYTANIDELFFKKKGRLWDEFIHLYQTLFSNADVYIQVVEALAKKQTGLTRKEIITATGLNDNGNLTKILKNLADSDFVRVYNTFGKKKNELIYQLADQYTLFYFRFLKDQYGKDEHFWTHTLDNPQRRTWAGYAFEQICKIHISQIMKSIGISAVLNEHSSWRSHESESGAQIDLLIARRDRVINVCEIKFSLSPYIIDKDYDMRLRNKLEVFRQETGTRDALNLTFITTYGVKQNMYSGLVQSEVTMDDLFAF
ncbi:MAG: ATP-binding protein, partial [Bacteroidaceae bacterium]|nr:ATP-binding protein [Bacteroidaceae bacterium]